MNQTQINLLKEVCELKFMNTGVSGLNSEMMNPNFLSSSTPIYSIQFTEESCTFIGLNEACLTFSIDDASIITNRMVMTLAGSQSNVNYSLYSNKDYYAYLFLMWSIDQRKYDNLNCRRTC